ncbi:M42 family metallopeptidase [Alkaliphilus crotonatoxidans]
MENKEFIQLLSETAGVSGHEAEVSKLIQRAFGEFCDEVKVDSLGNVTGIKKGHSTGSKIMLAAHMDEIGLMVKEIDEEGFVRITNIGGVDQRTLPCQEVVIHGREKVYGIIGVKPPHLTDAAERSKALKIEELMIDTGFTKEELKDRISIGDVITIERSLIALKNDRISGKALDDRAGIAALYICMKELKHLYHQATVYFTATVQEEVGTRGATTATYDIEPDIGLAIDVGFGRTPELNQYDTIELEKGPAITLGPNIHPAVFQGLKDAAKNNYINYQVEVAPGSSGTDAWPMQVSKSGVATGVLSIPLRYMHTSVETLSLSDIEKTGKLLASFVVGLNDKEMEEFLCY